MKKRMMDFLLSFLVVYVIVVASMYFAQRKLLYFPPKIERVTAEKEMVGYGPVTVLTADKIEITGYFRPPASPQKPIILAFHGNASHPLWLSYFFSDMVEAGYGIFLAEYRGYNNNEGSPTELGLYEDAEAYLNSIVLIEEYKNNPLVIYGQSLGSGVAVNLAEKHPERFKALVLEVPFDTLVSVVKNTYRFIPFPQLLLKDQYNSDQRIGNVKIPKLFFLGKMDEVVGCKSGKRLFDLAPEPKTLIEIDHAGHNDIQVNGTGRMMMDFIERILKDK